MYVICHDGTPYCDYKCPGCGFVMHVHKSQVPQAMIWNPTGSDVPNIRDVFELRTFCKQCGAELVLPLPVWIGDETNENVR